MRIVHRRPAPALARHVDRYWHATAPPGPLPALLPGTGAELWLHRGAPPHRDGAAGPLPRAHLVCLRAGSWRLTAVEPLDVLVVRLRAGALAALLGPRVDRLSDTVTDLAELWGTAGRRLGLAREVPDVERHLAALLTPVPERFRTAEAAVRLIRRDPGAARITELAARLGTTARTLQRTVPAVAGSGPKQVQRLARFQQLARSALLSPGRPDHLRHALAAGFYDQSHAAREFRRLTGATPGARLAPGTAHFYFPPLPRG
ncbi:helix-turn-helix domain-containing protein [Kitasatospora sp. NPDC088391]|uniref:helix-turn-helix domain-containing protein n=1 Tax=Kitasatospora sp. NPDC088391 TaxID=3364074 RepID=UPI00380B5D2A